MLPYFFQGNPSLENPSKVYNELDTVTVIRSCSKMKGETTQPKILVQCHQIYGGVPLKSTAPTSDRQVNIDFVISGNLIINPYNEERSQN